jgi:hypothetical protein
MSGQTQGWVPVSEALPPSLETVWLSDGKGCAWLGCRIVHGGGLWNWAQSNGIIYGDNGRIVSECESDDLDVACWHPLPLLP